MYHRERSRIRPEPREPEVRLTPPTSRLPPHAYCLTPHVWPRARGADGLSTRQPRTTAAPPPCQTDDVTPGLMAPRERRTPAQHVLAPPAERRAGVSLGSKEPPYFRRRVWDVSHQTQQWGRFNKRQRVRIKWISQQRLGKPRWRWHLMLIWIKYRIIPQH